jgi:hypothetical protein
MAKNEQLFHTIDDERMKELVKEAYLLDEVKKYTDKGKVKFAFQISLPLKGFDARKWNNPKSVKLHVAIGNKYKSYLVFIIDNRYGQQGNRLALPLRWKTMYLTYTNLC